MTFFFAAQLALRLLVRKKHRLRAVMQLNHIIARCFLSSLGIRLQPEEACHQEQGLVVANHTSWLDPIAMNALQPMRFITSAQVRSHPFLGTITRLAGCLFVSRSPWTLAQEIQTAVHATQKLPLAFYPEATSGDGRALLPFHSAFFETAIQTKQPVRPLLLYWNDERVAWFGDMTFLPHLFTLLRLRGLQLRIQPLAAVEPEPGDTRKTLTARVEKQMRRHFAQTDLKISNAAHNESSQACASATSSSRAAPENHSAAGIA